jgi:hypothetical protein
MRMQLPSSLLFVLLLNSKRVQSGFHMQLLKGQRRGRDKRESEERGRREERGEQWRES